MEISDTVLLIIEMIGTIAFAVSGAMTAIDRSLDLFGVLFLGVVTALGGGSIRDIILGECPPRMFYNYRFVLMAVITAVIVFVISYKRKNSYLKEREKISSINNIFDAIGLSLFTVTGVQTAINAGYETNYFLCVFLGMTTGVGGGVLRDMMSREIPYVLKKHIYATASITGGIIYCISWRNVGVLAATCLTMVIVFMIRMLATFYRWSLPKIHFDDMIE